jgi:transposase
VLNFSKTKEVFMLKLKKTKIAKSTEKRANEEKIYVGLDVHYKQWNITVVGKERELMRGKTVTPNAQALLDYLRRKIDFDDIIIAYEAGFSGFWIQREFSKLGINVIVVNPADIPTTDKESKQKTDRRDSMKIASTLRAGLLQAIYIPTVKEEENQSMIRRRFDLVKKQTRIKAQIKSFIKKHGISLTGNKEAKEKWSEKYIAQIAQIAKSQKGLGYQIESMLRELSFYQKEIKMINIALQDLSESEEYKTDYQNLLTMPGIGNIIATAILFELYNIERFETFSEFASYMGIIPTENSSGEKQRHGKMTKRGKTKLKSLIIEASWMAIKQDEAFKKYYNNLLSRMTSQRAIIRCARKLLSRVYHILKENEAYKYNIAA